VLLVLETNNLTNRAKHPKRTQKTEQPAGCASPVRPMAPAGQVGGEQ
jgi:hypothetical protein